METKAIVRGVRLSCRQGPAGGGHDPRQEGRPGAQHPDASRRRRPPASSRRRVESAIANAEHNDGADIDELKITSIYVEQGAMLKRFSARAKGRGNRISKPTCHIYVTVGN